MRARSPAIHDPQPADGAPAPVRVDQLAHELNSLLDGSMRSLRAARSALAQDGAGMSGEALGPIVHRLEAADRALRGMADLLERAMARPLHAIGAFRDSDDLGAALRRVLDLVAVLAEDRHVHLTASIAPQAIALPAGPLAPAILNGLRNAIEACGGGMPPLPGAGAPVDRVRLCIEVDERQHLHIRISDSGPGIAGSPSARATTKPGGHGLGLELCHQIASALHGSLSLESAPQGSAQRGAMFHLSVPVRSLTRP